MLAANENDVTHITWLDYCNSRENDLNKNRSASIRLPFVDISLILRRKWLDAIESVQMFKRHRHLGILSFTFYAVTLLNCWNFSYFRCLKFIRKSAHNTNNWLISYLVHFQHTLIRTFTNNKTRKKHVPQRSLFIISERAFSSTRIKVWSVLTNVFHRSTHFSLSILRRVRCLLVIRFK